MHTICTYICTYVLCEQDAFCPYIIFTRSVVKLQDGSVSDISDIHLLSDDSHVLVVGNRGFSLYQLQSQVYTLE